MLGDVGPDDGKVAIDEFEDIGTGTSPGAWQRVGGGVETKATNEHAQ